MIRTKHVTSCSTLRTGFCHLPNIFLILCQFCIFKIPRKHNNPHHNDSDVLWKHTNNINNNASLLSWAWSKQKKKVSWISEKLCSNSVYLLPPYCAQNLILDIKIKLKTISLHQALQEHNKTSSILRWHQNTSFFFLACEKLNFEKPLQWLKNLQFSVKCNIS